MVVIWSPICRALYFANVIGRSWSNILTMVGLRLAGLMAVKVFVILAKVSCRWLSQIVWVLMRFHFTFILLFFVFSLPISCLSSRFWVKKSETRGQRFLYQILNDLSQGFLRRNLGRHWDSVDLKCFVSMRDLSLSYL